jgi:hypothetical protein
VRSLNRSLVVVLAAKLDEYGKGAWIALMLVGFWLWWPAGVALLGFLLCSGRLGSWGHTGRGRWANAPRPGNGAPWQSAWGCGWNAGGRPPSSGNQAFDEYRAETLRRLEEEQREFLEYLERLRKARDKAEFDQFMAERRRRTTNPDAPESIDT